MAQRINKPDKIITNEQEIELLLINVRKKESEIIISYKDKKFVCKIMKLDSNYIFLHSKEYINLKFDDVDVKISFIFRGYRYIFHSFIASSELEYIKVPIPEKIENFKTRNSTRVNVNNRISLKFSIIKETKNTENNDTVKKSGILRTAYTELTKDKIDMVRIFSLVRSELLKITNNVIMKMNAKQEKLSKDFEIIQDFQKPLYLENANDLTSYLTVYNDIDYITYSPYFKFLKNNIIDQDKIKSILIKLRNNDLQNKRISYATYPIIVFGSVVGFIKLISNEPYIIKLIQEKIIKECVDLLSETIVKNYLFNLDAKQDFTMRAVNLSENGLLFIAKDKNLLKYLTINTRLKIVMKLDNNEIIDLTGSVKRINNHVAGKEIAIEFVNLKSMTKKKILTYLDTIHSINAIDEVLEEI